MTSTIDKIRAEIERRIKYIEDNEESLYEPFGKTCELKELLSFLDTLQEQEPQGLDEAAEKYRRDSCNAAMFPNIDGPMPEYGGSVKDAFKAGAEWMLNKMK